MKSASKRERARHAAEEEADEMMALKDRLAVMNEEVGGWRVLAGLVLVYCWLSAGLVLV